MASFGSHRGGDESSRDTRDRVRSVSNPGNYVNRWLQDLKRWLHIITKGL